MVIRGCETPGASQLQDLLHNMTSVLVAPGRDVLYTWTYQTPVSYECYVLGPYWLCRLVLWEGGLGGCPRAPAPLCPLVLPCCIKCSALYVGLASSQWGLQSAFVAVKLFAWQQAMLTSPHFHVAQLGCLRVRECL